MKKVRTHYDNLKVARDAPPEVIRAAYRSLAQKYHPDRNPGNDRAARIMKLVNTSYEVLCDPDQRARHDRWIAEQEATDQPEEQTHSEDSSEPPVGSPAEQRSYYQTGQVRRASHYERYWFVYLAVVVLVGGWLLHKHNRRDNFEIINSPSSPPISSEPDIKKADTRSRKKKTIPQQESKPSQQYPPRSAEPNPDVRDPPAPAPAPSPAPRRNTPEAYAIALSHEVGKDHTYPERAVKLGWQGTAEVLVRIGVDARVKEVSISQSSGYDILDEEALGKIRRVKSLPPPPDGFQGREFSILVPIVFNLDGQATKGADEKWVTEMLARVSEFISNPEDAREFLVTLRYESERANLDPQLVLALIDRLSQFRKFSVSQSGAKGYMHVNPIWITQIGESGQNLFNLRTNLRYGCTILRHYLDRENGNVYRALGAYENQSLGKRDELSNTNGAFANDVRRAWKGRWSFS